MAKVSNALKAEKDGLNAFVTIKSQEERWRGQEAFAEESMRSARTYLYMVWHEA